MALRLTELGKLVPQIVVIQRGEQMIPVQCFPVTSYDKFNKLCPEPQIPTNKDGKLIIDDPDYKLAEQLRATNRMNYLFINSLDIEWELVNKDDPNTWGFFDQELESHFTPIEINRLKQGCMDAQGISTDATEAARKDFLANLLNS